MDHLIIRSKPRRAFVAINRGDYGTVMAQVAPQRSRMYP